MRDVLDVGTTGHNNAYDESANNLAVAWELEKILVMMGHVVVMSRKEHNDGLPLVSRGELAKKHDCNLVLSLHCDAAENTRAYEMRTYYRAACGRSSDDYKIAHAVATSAPPLVRKTPSVVVGCMPMLPGVPGGVAPRAYNVLRWHSADVPAVLVEMGFITHPDVAEFLASKNGRIDTARAIATGIQSWYRDTTATTKHILTV